MASRLGLKKPLVLCIGLTAAAGCAEEPWHYGEREVGSAGHEVFHVFCKRTAKDVDPKDLDGVQYDPACLGTGEVPDDAVDPSNPASVTAGHRLNAMIKRREPIVTTVDRMLGDSSVAQKPVVTVLDADEIRTFLSDIVPLYDKPDQMLPESTRTIGKVLNRLIDNGDATGQKALTALSEIAGRTGYRRLDLALGVLRPLLEYPELDTLAESGLKVIAKGGKAEKAFDEITLGLALELANYDPAPSAPDSTLLIARDLMLGAIDQTDQPMRTPVMINKRDARGQAVPFGDGKSVPAPFVDADGDGRPDLRLAMTDVNGKKELLSDGSFLSSGGSIPAPYRVSGEDKATPRDNLGRAINAATGTQLYADFDAQPTMAGAFLREDARLSVPPQGSTRTTF
jgi:hypothetical protein